MTKNQPAAPAWAENLHPGAIVLFRFPERHDDLGGKKRPCLVLATRSQPNGLHVSLAYGTSVDSHANRGFDISIDPDDCEAVGTRRATRFVLARRITVAVTDPRFDTGGSDNPIVGEVLDDHMRQLGPLKSFLEDRVFEDCIPRPRRKPQFGRHRDQPGQALARTISDRREITTPPRRSRGVGRSARTVIVEHRRKRAPRSNSSAA